jgi:TetR/AcrR family transcriptional repressor of cmeABC operon
MEPCCQLAQPCTKRGLERRQKILQAAKTVFIEQGYANASINEIVRLSGGSLGTIYRFFGNKLGLFEAFFQQMTEDVFSHFETQVLRQGDIETNLICFGRQMQRQMFIG